MTVETLKKKWLWHYIKPKYFYIPVRENNYDFIFKVEDTTVEFRAMKYYYKYEVYDNDNGYIYTNTLSEFNFDLSWGDGEKIHINTQDVIDGNLILSHNYIDGQENHTISISGKCSYIQLQGYATEIVQWGNVGFDSLNYFNVRYENIIIINKLKTIPNTPITGCENVTDFFDMFYYSQIENVPDDMFKYCTNAVIINAIFGGCSKLKTIGNRVFKNLKKISLGAISVQIFTECTSLITIGDEMFAGCENIRSTRNIFEGNYVPNLYSLGDYTFKDCTGVIKADYTFFANESITYIGKGTFENCINCKDFTGLFWHSFKISKIPEDLFKGCYSAENFLDLFYEAGSQAIEDFTLPQNMFDDCPNANDFGFAFYNLGVRSWEQNGYEITCNLALKGDYIPLWEKYPNAKGNYCYYNCARLNNFENIPIDNIDYTKDWRSHNSTAEAYTYTFV